MKKPLVIHPFLFSIYPILFLFSHNMGQMFFSQTWPSMLISSGSALLLWWLLSVFLRNERKAGILVSIFFILFFSYGHVYRLLWGGQKDSATPNGHGYLLVAWVMVLVSVAYLVVRTRRGLQDLTRYLNAVAFALVVMSVVTVGIHEFTTRFTRTNQETAENAAMAVSESGEVGVLPDIYYIILDGYARADVLQEVYSYDNSEFLAYLSQKGFFVASKSRSNYAQTALSLASSLNLRYLDDLANQLGVKSNDRVPLEEMIRDNMAFRLLRERGYVIVAFSSGYEFTDLQEADIYMSPGWSWGEFEIALMNTTPISAVLSEEIEGNPYELHRKRILYTLEHLADVPEQKVPRFVFAHIIAPHPPFVFGQHGERINPDREFTLADGSHYLKEASRDQYLAQYTGQVIFVSDRIKVALDEILSEASRPTIVILQADHGPGSMLDWKVPENTDFKERLSILNAILLPDAGPTGLYEEISPVNTFRVIFRHYFGMNLELLPDESYFSTWKRPYDYINVTDNITSQ